MQICRKAAYYADGYMGELSGPIQSPVTVQNRSMSGRYNAQRKRRPYSGGVFCEL
jgi:hypothetical protein